MSLRKRIGFPPVADGLRIGLLGGSFNPPHAAHRALSLLALKRLGLDCVWWLVTPGNPLKDTRALPALDKRLAAARTLAGHPAIHVTGIEAALNTRYTVDTVEALRRGGIGGDDRVGVVRSVALDVRDRVVDAVDNLRRNDRVEIFGGPVVIGRSLHPCVG